MSAAFIVYGSSENLRKEMVEQLVNKYTQGNLPIFTENSSPDILLVTIPSDKKSVGIAQIKQAIKFLQERPFNLKNKLVVITDADKMTTEAQNALLKTLEEPPEYALIFLISPLITSLLETVQSRCRKISVNKTDTQRKPNNSIVKLVQLTKGERLDLAKDIASEEKEDLINEIDRWITEARNELIHAYTNNWAKNLDALLLLKQDLTKTNINVRLGIETFLLKLE